MRLFFCHFLSYQKILGLSLLALKYILLSWNLGCPNLSFFVKRPWLLVFFLFCDRADDLFHAWPLFLMDDSPI